MYLIKMIKAIWLAQVICWSTDFNTLHNHITFSLAQRNFLRLYLFFINKWWINLVDFLKLTCPRFERKSWKRTLVGFFWFVIPRLNEWLKQVVDYRCVVFLQMKSLPQLKIVQIKSGTWIKSRVKNQKNSYLWCEINLKILRT